MNEMLNIFKALSDNNRLRVFVALLNFEELCACQLTELLQIKGATCSRHMTILINSKLIESRKEGRWVYYRISKDSSSFLLIQKWIEQKFLTSDFLQKDIENLEQIVSIDPEVLCKKQRGDSCCD
ncbi:MAG: transcriptional regulator [Candidatus Cloacimonadota bacterium]|nr:MAG: transcriptional regulator [Candidatus Cloacimonadota bacterium]